MKMLARAALWLSALLACASAVGAPQISAPANNGASVPTSGIAFGPQGSDATFVDPTHPLPVAGSSIITSATFITPSGTTAYVAGQLVANSATAASVAPLSLAVCRAPGGTGMIRRVRVSTNDTGFAGATLRVHFHRDVPTYGNGDHAAWLTTDSRYMGAFDVVLDKSFSDVVKGIGGSPNSGGEINFDCAPASSVIYAEIEVRGAVTPVGGKTITVVAETLAN